MSRLILRNVVDRLTEMKTKDYYEMSDDQLSCYRKGLQDAIDVVNKNGINDHDKINEIINKLEAQFMREENIIYMGIWQQAIDIVKEVVE